MKVYSRTLLVALASGSAVWVAEPGHAHATVARVEAAAAEGAVVIENEVQPVAGQALAPAAPVVTHR